MWSDHEAQNVNESDGIEHFERSSLDGPLHCRSLCRETICGMTMRLAVS